MIRTSSTLLHRKSADPAGGKKIIEVIQSEADLDALKLEWNKLLGNSAIRVPFYDMNKYRFGAVNRHVMRVQTCC